MDKTPIRSLLVSGTYFPPQVGGISTMMAEVCRYLGPDQVAAVTGQAGTDPVPCLSGAAVFRDVAAFDQRNRAHLLHLGMLLARAMWWRRPQVLQFATADDAWIGWYTRRITRLPHVIYAHGNEVLGLARNGWKKPLDAFRNAGIVVANSRFTAGLVQDRLGVPAERVRIVPPGCDIERFRPVTPPQGLRERLTGRADAWPVLLSVGNLVERKGHDLVIRALPELKRLFPRISYVVIGEGRDRAMMEALARSLEVADVVCFAGRGMDADLAGYYAAADLFVMPSRARLDQDDVEGFGIVFLEAAACAKAVIGGRSGGIGDAVAEGRTGTLVDPHSVDDLVAAVKHLAEAPDRLRAYGEAGRERVEREFTWDLFGARIEEVLAEVAAAHRSPRATAATPLRREVR